MSKTADWQIAKHSAFQSALSIGLLGWFFAALRLPVFWCTGAVPVAGLVGILAAALALGRDKGNVRTAIAAAVLGILLALIEGLGFFLLALVALYQAL